MKSAFIIGAVVLLATACGQFSHDEMVRSIEEAEAAAQRHQTSEIAERLLELIQHYEGVAPEREQRFLEARKVMALFRAHHIARREDRSHHADEILNQIDAMIRSGGDLGARIGWSQKQWILNGDSAVRFVEWIDETFSAAEEASESAAPP